MKIKKEELELVKEQQAKLNNIVTQLGVLETQKHGLLHEVAGLNKEIESTKNTLEGKYGKVEIDLTDGTYKKIEEEVETA
jgi:hypothetical protein|tara:strand:- start:1095 stop:1334 length:240 start_codon:yes stop_codon:yes gene_type:complete